MLQISAEDVKKLPYTCRMQKCANSNFKELKLPNTVMQKLLSLIKVLPCRSFKSFYMEGNGTLSN